MKRFLCIVLIFQGLSATASSQREVYRLLDMFSDAFRYARSEYVKPVSEETLIEGAIQGMLSSLDPYSAYINQQRYQDMLKDIEGGYAGIGIEFTLDGDKLKIITPLDNSPAHRAGLKAGDIIWEINGESVQGLDLFEISDRLKGHPKEALSLKIERELTNPFTVKLKREKIVLNPITWKIAQNMAYVRLSNFNDAKTAKKFKKAIETIQSKMQGALQGLVIDLRNNPGGILDQAVSIADLLLDKGIIVKVKSRKAENDAAYLVSEKPKILKNIPIVVLVNKGTASSAEILAAALKDHDRAFLMGSKTYGKGSIQTILPIPPGYTAIRLTTGYYYSPLGKSIQGKGIEPHENMSDSIPDEEVLSRAFHTLLSLKK
ncbi:MAG: S41 family peptidase [Alphaproteobacteria bacterium]